MTPDSNSHPEEASGGSLRCPSCDAPVNGNYCAQCGQDNRSRRLSFIYGHCFLLQMFVVPLGGNTHVLAYSVFTMLPLVYFSWAAIPFCRAGPLKGLTLSFLAHVVYLAVMSMLGIALAMLVR